MKHINSPKALYHELNNMSKDNSVSQFRVPGMGQFVLVYQDDDFAVEEEINSDEDLQTMIQESIAAYKRGDYQTTTEILKEFAKEW